MTITRPPPERSGPHRSRSVADAATATTANRAITQRLVDEAIGTRV
jgi:hypothetical protein